MTHKGTQTIHTERLVLRKFSAFDANAMFKNWGSDERVSRYLAWQPHKSVKETKKLLRRWHISYKSKKTYNWAMEYKGMPIGSISVCRMSERDEAVELGYCMGYEYWNKGFMTEAAKAVIDFLFAEVGVNRVSIAHAVKNPASGKVAQKCGLTFEGTLREYCKASSGEFHDISYYGITRSEWENLKCNNK